MNEVCLQETSSTSGEMNWDAGVSYTYTTPNCMGVATTHALTLSCSTTSSSYYGFPAHYYWKLTSSSSNNTLSAGAIAGIVIGSVVGVGLIVGLILYFVFMFKTKAPLSSQT